eukprot:TRINITY_DN8223_c0_g1_i2.p2 TRINITY_DN8223_c0_g1~~TRINITY_DN8223_c0_g1_i2.p2  ORF type:complete len:302 (+),score=36.00 TRINITY_DN8223_c0_g1_i2:1159-2064(+)
MSKDKIRISVDTPLMGHGQPSVSLEHSRRFTRSLTLGLKTQWEMGALIISPSIDYYDHCFQIPIVMDYGASLAGMVLCGLGPFVITGILSRHWFEPTRDLQKRRKAAALRTQQAARIAQMKDAASRDVQLMFYSVQGIIRAENARSGLIITRAIFGNLALEEKRLACQKRLHDLHERRQARENKLSEQQDNDSDNDDEWEDDDEELEVALTAEAAEYVQDSYMVDVTVPLQNLVVDGRLTMLKASKTHIEGFYDPCPGDRKHLQIEYTFGNRHMSVTQKESAPIQLPLLLSSAHLVHDPTE